MIWLANGFNFGLRPGIALINPSVFLRDRLLEITSSEQNQQSAQPWCYNSSTQVAGGECSSTLVLHAHIKSFTIHVDRKIFEFFSLLNDCIISMNIIL